jgi:hypothetical protein
MSWELLIAAGIAIVSLIGLIIGLFQWQDRRIHGRLKAWEDDFGNDVHEIRREVHEAKGLAQGTRDELYRDYVRLPEFNRLRADFRGDFDKVFGYLTGMTRDLNRLIGRHTPEVTIKPPDNDD